MISKNKKKNGGIKEKIFKNAQNDKWGGAGTRKVSSSQTKTPDKVIQKTNDPPG